MKKVNIIGTMTLAALALWAVISCETPASPGMQTPPLTISADGSDGAATTKLALSLNPGIPGLTVEDITIDPEAAFTKGILTMDSADGASYTLAVSAVLNTGNVTVTVAKDGQAARSASVKVYSGAEGLDVTLTVTANGAQGATATTALTLAFNPAVPGLTAGDITLSGGITNGTLTGDGAAGASYTLAVSNITAIAQITVTVNKAGYNVSPAPVTVYAGTGGESLTAVTLTVTANGAQGATATTALTLAFSPAISGLTAEDITLGGGVVKGALSGDGASYNLAVTVTKDGPISVVVSKAGYEVSPATVNVSGPPPPPNISQKTGRAASPSTGIIELTMDSAPAPGIIIAWGTSSDKAAAESRTISAADVSGAVEGNPFVWTIPGLTLGETYHVWINSENLGAIPVHFTEADLAKIGVDEAFPLSGEYYLTRSLDLSVLEDQYEEEMGGWTPIGVSGDVPFSGKFDGKNFTISNLALAQYDTVYIGLFGYVKGTADTHAEIKNLTVTLDEDYTDLDLTLTDGVQYVGVVSGRADYTSFENITVKGSGISIEKDTNTAFGFNFGGISGYTYTSTITDSSCELDIDAKVTSGTGGLSISGIAGYVSTITDSIYTGDITCQATGGTVLVGGLNYGRATITDSHATGNITATGNLICAGGLVGESTKSIKNSSFTGSIDAQSNTPGYAGGIAGNATVAIENCSVSLVGNGINLSFGESKTQTGYAGGIVGYTTRAVKNCYASGSAVNVVTVYGTTDFIPQAGGIVGDCIGNSDIENCYTALQSITASSSYGGNAGGIGGYTNNFKVTRNAVLSGVIKHSYTSAKSNYTTAYRISDKQNGTFTGNVALSGVTLYENTAQQTPASNTSGTDGLTIESIDWSYFTGTLQFSTDIWKWDSVSGRPKLVWE